MTSLYKALRLLDLFDNNRSILGVSEIARESKMLKSSVFNIMSTFCAYGLVEKTQDNRYQLGKKTAELSNVFLKNFFGDYISGIKLIMNKISNEINENLFLAVSNVPNVLYLDSITPSSSYTRNNVQGLVVPMHCTGIGKAMLALCSDKEIEETCKAPMKSYTENTIVDGEKLFKEIEQIKKRGYAIDNMEHEFGVKCVAIAFKGGENIYGVSISGPSLRFSDEKSEEYYNLLKNRLQSYMNIR